MTLTVPAAPLSGTVNMTATATDANSGIASVRFEYRKVGVDHLDHLRAGHRSRRTPAA